MIGCSFCINHIVNSPYTSIPKVRLYLNCINHGSLDTNIKCNGICYKCDSFRCKISVDDYDVCTFEQKKQLDEYINSRIIEQSYRLYLSESCFNQNIEIMDIIYKIKDIKEKLDRMKIMCYEDIGKICNTFNKKSKLEAFYIATCSNPNNKYLEDTYNEYKYKLKDEVKELYNYLKEKYKDKI